MFYFVFFVCFVCFCFCFYFCLTADKDKVQDIQDKCKVKDGTAQYIWDEWEMQEETEHTKMEDEEEEQAVPRNSPNLGDVITHILERMPKKKETKKARGHRMSSKTDACFQGNINTNPASSNPVKMQGKGAVIYEDKEDTNDNSFSENTTSPSGIMASMDALHVPPDKDMRITGTVKLESQTLTPCHLRVVFGDAYIESKSQPRRFAIDISERSAIVTDGDVYVLFEEVNDDNKEFLNVKEKFLDLEHTSVR